MRRPSTVAVLVAGGLAAVPAPAVAQQPQTVTVSAQNFSFAPAQVTVNAGDTVRWQNLEGFHNVHFDFSPAALFPPARPDAAVWQNGVAQTFSTPGTYTYFCDPHRAIGMVATITVSAPTAQVRRLAVARSGASVLIDLSAPAAVRGTLERRGRAGYRAFGTIDFGTVEAGARRLALRRTAEGRRLTSGRYRLRLEVAGAAQRALAFTVPRR